ncbi:unnamed protein product [Somion occarium]|uniref:Major facilitator superfamily (MFS) profile domain-containing protein n=1 Tax=Somion occarium TaxID=3059160 RepID=A0ABP1DI20_9APHY
MANPSDRSGLPEAFSAIEGGSTEEKISAHINVAQTGTLDMLEERSDYAEGKWHAWSTVFGAWLIQFCAVGIITSFGVFEEFYTTTWLTKMSASSISWIGSAQIFLEYSIAPFAGKLLDHGYFRSIVITGCFLFVLSLALLSLAQENQYYQAFLAQAIGMGLGVGILFLPTSLVSIKHFRSGHAFVIGIVDSSISLGGVIFSIMLNYLLHGSVGFAWGVRIAALITLVCFVIGYLMMYWPKKPFGGQTFAPADTHSLGLRHFSQRDLPYILTLCQGFIMSLGTFVPSFYVQLFAEMHGTSKTLSFYALAVLNFSGMFGRIAPNYVGDRVGLLNVYIPRLTLTGVLCFAMLAAGTPQGLFLFAIFYGFFFGATNSMYLPLVTSVTAGGTRIGFSLVPPAVAALVGPPIAGSILGPHYVWWQGITFASVTMLAATGICIWIKVLTDRAKTSHWTTSNRD